MFADHAFQLDEGLCGLGAADIPHMSRITQALATEVEADVPAAVRRELEPFMAKVQAGQQIAITGSSRGIANLALVLRECARAIAERGAQPFVVPGMGSHGGATAAGQTSVLEHNGITEAFVGCPIRASMDVIQVGTTRSGFPVFQDRLASEADGILVVNRVKPHTGFTGRVESGVCKMLVIGLGKQAGASKIHQQALEHGLGQLVLDASKIIVECGQLNFVGALGLVENGCKQTAMIKGIALDEHEALVNEEATLLEKAYRWMPRLPFEQLDLLIVDEMGKNISGAGMDSNVIGVKPGLTTPRLNAIYVRGLTEETNGNAIGAGNATVMLRSVVEQIDLHSTYMNAFTAKRPDVAKLPMLVETELQALQVCLSARASDDPATARIAWIENTSKLGEMWVSSALLPEIADRAELSLVSEPRAVRFDAQDGLVAL